MQNTNIALITTLYNTKNADFYKDIYFPIIKYAAMNIFYEAASFEKYYDITELQNRISEKIGITIPISVLRNSIKALSKKSDSDVLLELYQKGDYFIIRKNWDASINANLEAKSDELSRKYREIELFFKEYLEIENLSSNKTFFDFFKGSSEDVVNYINAIDSRSSINEEYVNVVRFIEWLKDSKPSYYDVVNNLFWGSIIAGFLQRKKFDADIKVSQEVYYYLDTSLVLSLLELDSEENILYAQDLLRIIKESGSVPCVHPLTIREIIHILQSVEISQAPKPGTSIGHAWTTRNLCLSDLLHIKNTLWDKIQKKLGITIPTMPTSSLSEIENKYRNNNDVRLLANERGSHDMDKLREIHDIYMRDYVHKQNKEHGGASIENQSVYFVSMNRDLITFSNRGGQIESVIHAGRVIMTLWLHSSRSSNIQQLLLTETMSRCFALNQTDVRNKLHLFLKYYKDTSLTKEDVNNMYTSLIHRSTHTITEVEKLESLEFSDMANKESLIKEISQGIVSAVTKEASERNKIIESVKNDVDALKNRMEEMQELLSKSEEGLKEQESFVKKLKDKDSINKETIETLKEEIHTRDTISRIEKQIHAYKEQLIPLNIQREQSVSMFKFKVIISAEVIGCLALIFCIILAISRWDSRNIFSAINISSALVFLGLILRLNTMYLLAPGPNKTRIRNEQLAYWDSRHPQREEILKKLSEIEKEKRQLEKLQ